MVTAADYDRDGFLDLYVAGTGDQENTTQQPAFDARNGRPGVLLRNRGDGRLDLVLRNFDARQQRPAVDHASRKSSISWSSRRLYSRASSSPCWCSQPSRRVSDLAT